MTYISNKDNIKKLSLTIYNHNIALVKETRSIHLTDDETEVWYLDVAKEIDVASIMIDGLDVKECNYEYDLVSKEKLLEKYIGQVVYMEDQESGDRQEYRLLSTVGGIVLERVSNQEIWINPSNQLILPALPDGLMIKPGLRILLKPTMKSKEVQVSYLTKGFSWDANYVIHLQDKHLHLFGWAQITNKSGMTYDGTKLKLMAGEVKYLSKRESVPSGAIRRMSKKSGDIVEEESFEDYYLYTFPGTTTLKDQQSKQLRLLHKENISYIKYYEYDCYFDRTKAILEIMNREDNNLGIVLPKGNIKVYREDLADGNPEFIGQDSIKHTSKNEKITLHIGSTFDLKCKAEKIEHLEENGYQKITNHLIVKNHKLQSARVKCRFYVKQDNWEMLSSSADYEIQNEANIIYWVQLEPKEEKAIELTYQYKEPVEDQ